MQYVPFLQKLAQKSIYLKLWEKRIHIFSFLCSLMSVGALLYVLMLSSASATETKDWYAWIDLMPPKPDNLHVIGDVFVGNPGIEANLYVKEPQGVNPNILQLDLYLVQKTGYWIQVMTWIQARFDKVITPDSIKYNQIEIFLDNESIAKIPVEEVH